MEINDSIIVRSNTISDVIQVVGVSFGSEEFRCGKNSLHVISLLFSLASFRH